MIDDLLNFIDQHTDNNKVNRRPVGFGVTIAEYASAKGYKYDKAKRLLDLLESDGILQRREMLAEESLRNSRWRGFVYARPDDWKTIGM